MAIKGSGNKMVSTRNYLGNISRTKVNNKFDFRTTFSSGFLFPIYASEVLPSENKRISCAELIRTITPLGPTMDNSFIDIFFFFVPNRLLWEHWEEFIAGYNKEAWAQDVEYTVPKIIFRRGNSTDSALVNRAKFNPDDTVSPPSADTVNRYLHSFLDYLPGACDPVMLNIYLNGVDSNGNYLYSDLAQINELCGISALYPRAYVKIWNDWFRDENLQDELQLYTGDSDEYADSFSFNLLSKIRLPKACKYHNRFTSALPQPVKGPDVLIPMENLPVLAGSSVHDMEYNLKLGNTNNVDLTGKPLGVGSGGVAVSSGSFTAAASVDMSNLYAKNVSNTIRMLRLATQTELLLARDARGGTRYIESLLAHFGVHNGDARLQRSEYLGSKQIPLNITQVTNTAGTATNPLGNVGGQSVTKSSDFYFSKGFSEHGIVLGLATVRTNISYSSGIRKQYQRFTRFEHTWPEFKHVGDVSLLTKEVKLGRDFGTTFLNDTVFGYTPYGSELREGYNYNNGLFRNQASDNLSYLTYQEHFYDPINGEVVPVLSSDYIKQDSEIFSNTLVDQTGPQFYALFSIQEERIIPLDPTSDPGLMDHF